MAKKTTTKTEPKVETKEPIIDNVVDPVSDTPKVDTVEPPIEPPKEDPIIDPVGNLTEDPHTTGVIITATKTINYGDILFIEGLEHNLSKKEFESRKDMSEHFCQMIKKGILKVK